MSHAWNFELKIYVKWLVKFRRRIVQKLKVSEIIDFRSFQIRDRHNSSTWTMAKFLFSIFKNSTRVMIEHKISGSLEHCKGLKTPSTLCNLLLKSRYIRDHTYIKLEKISSPKHHFSTFQRGGGVKSPKSPKIMAKSWNST